MSKLDFLILVLLLGLGVHLTRWLPFWLFGGKKELPPVISFLGKVLPAAMAGLLVIYCFKDYSFSDLPALIPALIAAAVTAGLHLWKRNMILSIAVGTAAYMVLINVL